LGQIKLIRGNLSDAQHYFDVVIASNFKSVEAHFLKGYIAWKKGARPEALSLLKNAVEHSQADKPVHSVLGEGDTKTGKSFQRSNRQKLFQIYVEDLSGLGETSLSQLIDLKYQKLDTFLDQIRRRIQS